MRRAAPITTRDAEAGETNAPELKRGAQVSERTTFTIFVVILTACLVFLATVADPKSHTVQQLQVPVAPVALVTTVSTTSEVPPPPPLPATPPPTSPPTPPPSPVPNKLGDLTRLNDRCIALINDVRSLKQSGAVMEVDTRALAAVQALQGALRQLLTLRFGDNPTILVEMLLKFPESMPDYAEHGAEGRIVIEMAPVALAPYSTYNFLEIVRRFKSGAFHRNAGHVLQAMVNLGLPTSTTDSFSGNLAFQEYHPGFPHKRYTLGYAGRPGGPEFYISTVDNTDNHGPGSQGSKTEADACFGRLLDADSIAVVKRMQTQPGAARGGGMGFVSDAKHFIVIKSLKLLRPFDAGADV